MNDEMTQNPVTMGEDPEASSVVEFSTSVQSKSALSGLKKDTAAAQQLTFSKMKQLLVQNKVTVARFSIEIIVFIVIFVVTAVYYSNQKIVSLVSTSQCSSVCDGSCEYGTIFPAQDAYEYNVFNIAYYNQSTGILLGYSTLMVSATWNATEVLDPDPFASDAQVGVSSIAPVEPSMSS